MSAAAVCCPVTNAFRLTTHTSQLCPVFGQNLLIALYFRECVSGRANTFQASGLLWRQADTYWDLAAVLRRALELNRGHLLGAFIPLYLAWVAGHINLTAAGTGAEAHIEALAAAFEADKPYVVSRWRWPDRFNA